MRSQVVYPDGRPRRRAAPPLETLPSATAYVNNNTVYFSHSTVSPVGTASDAVPSPLYAAPGAPAVAPAAATTGA